MGIQNIPTSSTPSSMVVPTPPPLQEIIQSGTTAPLSQNPLSGSILKLLADNGFKQKIETGYTQGHTYTILHSAPSTDFTLIDTWTETRVDESGNTISVPRKKYHIFTITEPATTPEPVVALGSVAASEIATDPEPEKLIIVETPPVQTPSPAETDASRAQAIAEKIKRGGAGMTPEDWQFRNENWPLIEAALMPKPTVTAAEPVTSTASDTQNTPLTTPVTEEELPNTIKNLKDPLVEATPSESHINNQEIIQESSSTPSLTPQHYDARAWLMQKLKQGNPSLTREQRPASSVTSVREQSSPENSYNLLKKRFSSNSETEQPSVSTKAVPTQAVSSPTNSVTLSDSTTTTTDNPENVASQNPMGRRDVFLKTIFGTNMYIWERAQSIPARAFIYPSEYTWGTNEQGKPVERSLDDYPVEARRLRQKIAQSVEDVATQGTPIETTSIGMVLDTIFNKGIL